MRSHCTTGEDPAYLMLGRQLGSTLDLLHKMVSEVVKDKNKTVQNYNGRGIKEFRKKK